MRISKCRAVYGLRLLAWCWLTLCLLGSWHAFGAEEPATTAPAGSFSVPADVLAAADRAIVEPTEESQLPELLSAIERHPYYLEVVRRLREYGPDRMEYTRGKHLDEKGEYTADRARLHREIVAKLLNPAARCESPSHPVALIVIGLPGAGKSSTVEPLAKKLGLQFTRVNPDEAQMHLPEYEGWNADIVHAEARDIYEKELLPAAIEARHNLIVDVTGRTSERTVRLANRLAGAGYELEVAEVKLPTAKAVYRTWQRFRRGAFARPKDDPDAGRFVPPQWVANAFGDKPDQTYALLKKLPAARHWLQVSGDGKIGTLPRVLEEGSRAKEGS